MAKTTKKSKATKKNTTTKVSKNIKPKKVKKAKVVRKKTTNKKNVKPQSKRLHYFMYLLWLMLVAIIMVIVYISYCYLTLPDFSKAMYTNRNQGIKILAQNGREITSYGGVFANSVDIKDLPDYVPQAIIDTEDRRFYKHSGFDYIGFTRAMGVNLINFSYKQGASTITQQVAKNLLLSSDKSIKRKVQELILAKQLERNFSKKQILNIYMNRVFLGNGAYGINSASYKLFNKPAKDLNLHEAAIIAGSLKAPSRYNYLKNKDISLKRASVVLSLMQRAGTISQQERENALNLKVSNNKQSGMKDGKYLGDFVLNSLSNDFSNYDNDIYIKTTIDYDLNQKAEKILQKNIKENIDKNVTTGAIVILDKNGAIKAMVGGYDYKTSQFNRAYQAYRQPGSLFKLFVYVTALKDGYNLTDTILDEPVDIDGWKPSNYNHGYQGEVSVMEAFAKSLNLATIDLALKLDLDDIIKTAYKMGITTEIKEHLSIVLGSSEVLVLDIANAYNVIANGGYASFNYVIDNITDSTKNILYKHINPPQVRVLEENIVNDMDMMLQEVIINGTAKKLKSLKNIHGKTGTSQNYRDAWFAGYNDKYTVIIWLGNDDNTSMKDITGGSLPVKIFKEILE